MDQRLRYRRRDLATDVQRNSGRPQIDKCRSHRKGRRAGLYSHQAPGSRIADPIIASLLAS
jgi:hypothetical protein